MQSFVAEHFIAVKPMLNNPCLSGVGARCLFGRTTKQRHTGYSDLFNMPMVGATAAAHHIQVAQASLERSILTSQLGWIADIKFWGLVQLGMAHA